MPNGPLADALRAAEPRPKQTDPRKDKKNYAERLSRAIAQQIADSLRKQYKTILPDAGGGSHESRAASAHGVKKLDVNYSTPELGLGFGVSIKTLNFIDKGTQRYTKNYSRIDNELRAEAIDYHLRQPYAVMIALIFLPEACCLDGITGPSSFGRAVQYYRKRAKRDKPTDDPQLFERVFIGLYSVDEPTYGQVRFIDVFTPPPRRGPPNESQTIDYSQVIKEIEATFLQRNNPPVEWAD